MTEPSSKDWRLLGSNLVQFIKGLIGLILFAIIWFAIAGRWTWWQGWLVLLSFTAYVGFVYWHLAKENPELLKERNKPASSAETWDHIVIGIYTVFLVLMHTVAALDAGRYQWSFVPLGVQVVGWLLLAAAGFMTWHVMMTNPYLSSWARIQEDRGQRVVQDGAYRHIRHPMYLGVMAAFLALPLILCSWWALIPGVMNVGLFVFRTYREDRMLLGSLPGYAEYAQRFRYRLLPGIW